MNCDSCGKDTSINWGTGGSIRCDSCCDLPYDETLQEIIKPTLKEVREALQEEKHRKKRLRLGYDFDIAGVDPEYVPTFAKALRIAGVVIVITLLLWGNLYEWSWGDSPFEQVADVLGVRSRYETVVAFALTCVIAVVGFYYRFRIGTFVMTIFYGLFTVLSRLFKSV